jgi:hypothetical protein
MDAIAEVMPPNMRQDRTAISERAATDVGFVADLAMLAFALAEQDREVRHMIWEELFDVPNMIAPILASNVLGSNRPYTLYLAGSIARHPFNVVSIRDAFDESDITLSLVDELAPCQKALEIARTEVLR